jgi:hypothetical protein
VALNLAVGIVALAVRSQDRSEGRRTLAAGGVVVPLDPDNGGGILAGGSFDRHRGGSNGSSTSQTTTAAGGVPTTGGPDPGSSRTTGAAATTAAAPSTGRPGATTGPSVPAATTATTPRPPGPTATTPAPPGTTPSTSRPAATQPPTSATTATTSAATIGPARQSALTDPEGDTFIDGTSDPITEPRADVVRTGVVYEPDWITFSLQVKEPTDPRADARWAGDSSFAAWSVDTNRDGTPDFEVQYFVADGALGGSVSKLAPDGSSEVVCDAHTANYTTGGSSVTVASDCLGKPASFAYVLTIYYDTNPKDPNSDVASDVTPNGGLSFPVTRPS